MRKTQSDSGRHIIIEHDVISPVTGQVTYVMRSVIDTPPEDLKETEAKASDLGANDKAP